MPVGSVLPVQKRRRPRRRPLLRPPLTAALPTAVDGYVSVFGALVESLLAYAAHGSWKHVLFGLAASDLLAAQMCLFPGTHYVTRIYHVAWPDGDELRKSLDGRPTYLELGCL